MGTGLPERLVLATHNPGKIEELQILLRAYGVETVTAASLGLESPEETGSTYEENAALKARATADDTGLTALADDTGLAVDRLGGSPGIHTARYAQRMGGWPAARVRLADELGLRTGQTATASLCCALSVVQPNAGEVTVYAEAGGTLRWPPIPNLPGFASMFVPDTDALITEGVLVHRRKAFELLLGRLRAAGATER